MIIVISGYGWVLTSEQVEVLKQKYNDLNILQPFNDWVFSNEFYPWEIYCTGNDYTNDYEYVILLNQSLSFRIFTGLEPLNLNVKVLNINEYFNCTFNVDSFIFIQKYFFC